MTYQLHHKLFFAFLCWTALCCFMSPWPALAVYGFHMRYEGLLTYVICLFLAIEYWKNFATVKGITLPLILLSVIYPFIHSYTPEWAGWLLVPQVAIGAMCAVGFGILYPINRYLTLPIAIAGIWTGSRAFFVCMILTIAITECLNFKQIWRLKWFLAAFGLLVALVLPFTPLKQKLENTRFDFQGSRSQWIYQAIGISKALPLTGYGLDTGSEWLKPAKGRTAEHKDVIADRVHNIYFDVLIWTGWIGAFIAVIMISWTLLTAFTNRTLENVACGLGIASYLAFSVFNPLGAPSLALFFICILGVRK